jgi:hypothetical protein
MSPVSPKSDATKSCPRCGQPVIDGQPHNCSAPRGVTFDAADRERPAADPDASFTAAFRASAGGGR